MAAHHQSQNIFTRPMPPSHAHVLLDRAQQWTPSGASKMFDFSRFSGCIQMDVQHVVTGYIPAADADMPPDIGYRFNETFIQILNAMDPDFLVGYLNPEKRLGTTILTLTSIRTLFKTFFEDVKIEIPPAALNGQILSRVWTSETDDVTQSSIAEHLNSVYYHSFHRAYHSRLPLESLRGITARNSLSFARPSFVHVPLSFTEPEPDDMRSTVFVSDYLKDIFMIKSFSKTLRYTNSRTSHILSWNTLTDRVGAFYSIADAVAFHTQNVDIADCFTNYSQTITRLSAHLADVRFAVVCLDKFDLHHTTVSETTAW